MAFAEKIAWCRVIPVDGLQSLDQWKSAFNNPSGGKVFHMKPALHSEMLNMSKLSAWCTERKPGAYFRPAPRGENHTVSQNIGALLSYQWDGDWARWRLAASVALGNHCRPWRSRAVHPS